MSNHKKEGIMRIYIEGIDLSGKSSAAADFASQSEKIWATQHGQLSSDSQLYDFATEAFSKYPLDVVGDLLSAAIRADLAAYAPPEIPTIQDSLFTVRSLAFFTALKNNRLVTVFEDLLQSHPTFDHSFVFTASVAARQARLQQRINEHPQELSIIDKVLIDAPDFAAAVNNNIIGITSEAFDATLIDTTNLSINNVSNIMTQAVVNEPGGNITSVRR